MLVSGDLYMKGLNGTLLRCLEKDDYEWVLAEVHDVICDLIIMALSLLENFLGLVIIDLLCKKMSYKMLIHAKSVSYMVA